MKKGCKPSKNLKCCTRPTFVHWATCINFSPYYLMVLKRRNSFDRLSIAWSRKIIETLRRRKRLTQQEVAFRCNLDRKTISNIVRNDSSPSVETLLNIILALNVTPSEFVVEFEKHTNILDYYPYSEDMP